MKHRRTLPQFAFIYIHYREFMLPVGTVFICVILFLFVDIPQIQQFLSLQDQLAQNQEQLRILQKNFQQITGLNDQQLNQDFTTVTTALPIEKDPISILNTISHAASVTNVSLKDYNLTPGQLAISDTDLPLQFSLTVDGTLDNVQKFTNQLAIAVPLSTLSLISGQSSTSATMQINFYTKPANKFSFDQTQPFQLLSPENKTTLLQLDAWENKPQ